MVGSTSSSCALEELAAEGGRAGPWAGVGEATAHGSCPGVVHGSKGEVAPATTACGTVSAVS
jgi:hypothetical protein